MTKRLLAAGVAAGVIGLVPAAPAQAQSGRCTQRGAETILQTPSVRIYATPLGDTAARVYGCLYSQNRRRFLGIDGDCQPGPAISEIVSRGRFVAFAQSFCNLDASDDYVVVRDLRTNRNVHRGIAAEGTPAENSEPSTLLRDLALASNGSVAWIGEWQARSGGGEHPNNNLQVRKLDTTTGTTAMVLDSSRDIDPRSLGLSQRSPAGSWIYWTRGEAPQSARLR